MAIQRNLAIFINKKVNKKRNWSVQEKEKKEHFMFKPKPQYLVCLEPSNYTIVQMFESITQMEKDTNRRHLQPLLNKYFKGQLGKSGSPLICNWIVVKIQKEELIDISIEDLQVIVRKRAIDNILFMQMQRIRDNMDAFTHQDKEKIHKFLINVESPNPKAINYEIK